MAGDLVAKFRLDGDASGLKRSLEESRAALLRSFADAKSAIAPATQALAEAQAHAQRMAQALKSEGKSGEDFARWMHGAEEAVKKAKEEVLSKTAALQGARQAARGNASAISQAAQLEQVAIKASAAAVAQAAMVDQAAAAARDAAHRKMLEQSREEIRARREMAAEQAADALKVRSAVALDRFKRGQPNVLNSQETSTTKATGTMASQMMASAMPPTAPQKKALTSFSGSSTVFSEVQAVENSTNRTVTAMRHLGHMGLAAFVAPAVLSGIKDAAVYLARVADEAASTSARVKLASRSLAEFGQTQAALRDLSKESGVPVAHMAGLYQRVAEPIREMGGSAKDAQMLVDMLGKSLRVTGATAEEQASAFLQFSQAMGAGVLQGEELRAMKLSAPRMVQAIADGLGVNAGDLKKMGEEGSLTSKKVFEAAKSQYGSVAEEASRLPKTLGMGWTNFQEAVKKNAVDMDNAVGVTHALGSALSFAGDHAGAASLAMTGAGTGAALLATRLSASAVSAGTAGMALRALGVVAPWLAGIGVLATVGGMAWEMWGRKGGEAGGAVAKNLGAATSAFESFAGKAGDKEYLAQVTALKEEIQGVRDKLLDPAFRLSDLGKQAEEEVARAESALERLAEKRAKAAPSGTAKERTALGLDDLRADTAGLLGKDFQTKLNSLDSLWQKYTQRRVEDNNLLSVSYMELSHALSLAMGEAKTPAEFGALSGRLVKALQSTGGRQGNGALTLRAQLENAIESRAQAETKELEQMVSGLSAKMGRVQAVFDSTAKQAALASMLVGGMAKAQAELAQDKAGVSAIDAAQSRGEVAQTQAGTALKLAAIAEIHGRKVALSDEEARAQREAANADIEAARASQRQKLMILEAEAGATREALGKNEEVRAAAQQRALSLKRGDEHDRLINDASARQVTSNGYIDRLAQIEDEKRKLAEDTTKAVTESTTRRVQAEVDASRRARDIAAEENREKKALLEDLQKTAATQAQSALERYKSYAQQVIDLDKQIAHNRLDTAASIHALKREDLSPSDKAKDIRSEMAENQSASNAAYQSGDKAGALDILNRNRGLATELAHTKGDGVDPKAMKTEGIAALGNIGAQVDAILREQREEAVKAAQEQKNVYVEMTQAVKNLAQEIGKLNASEAIKLKTEINTESLQTAIGQIRAALSKETFQLNVAAGNVGAATPSGLSPAAMAVASQAPAGAVMAAANAVGAASAAQSPAKAGPSLVERAVAPVVASQAQRDAWKSDTGQPGGKSWGDGKGGLAPGIQSLQPVNMTWPDGRRSQVWTKPDAAGDLHRAIQDTASMWGQP